MAENKTTQGNTAVSGSGDHDRVVMLSLRADGTPDQHNPEIIGDKDAAVDAAKRQFAVQAVSTVDVEKRGVSTGGVTAADRPDSELKKAHDKAAAAAEKTAESVVNSLHKG